MYRIVYLVNRQSMLFLIRMLVEHRDLRDRVRHRVTGFSIELQPLIRVRFLAGNVVVMVTNRATKSASH
jgi:hypothetical protein